MPQGLHFQARSAQEAEKNQSDFYALLMRHHLEAHVRTWVEPIDARHTIRFVIEPSFVESHLPGFDTLQLHQRDDLVDEGATQSVKQQILVSMLSSPIELGFPSYSELLSAIHMRELIVCAARKTSMAFNTDLVDRPIEHWRYQEDVGFTLKPGKSLIEALLLATQPDRSGRLYGFSCYRATEYVILLAIAQEAQQHNPQLLAQLEEQWQHKAVMSGKFHDVFLHEVGTNDHPLPTQWFVPGDRVWFRNPDDASSDVPGYEGSWVIYLGHGQFANFWHPQKPYDLESKCLELYHWRHGVFVDAAGQLRMDEEKVAEMVSQTKNDPTLRQYICQRMMRLRDPQGVYAEGGCMDNTRESPRWIHPATTDISLPIFERQNIQSF
jgi:hypothetical protein